MVPVDRLATAVFLSLLVSILSVRFRFLSKAGGVAQFLLGVLLLGFGGWKWAVPMVAFFVLSSFLSVFSAGRHQSPVDGVHQPRNERQVLANGVIPGLILICHLIYMCEFCYASFIGAVAAATADTWGTELGRFSVQDPVSLRTLKRTPKGRSGAVSLKGTLGGVLGSGIIGLTALPWSTEGPSADLAAAALLGGISGSLADSLAGALFQSEFQCRRCLALVERRVHCSERTHMVKGFLWVGNDTVNVVCTIAGGMAPFLLRIA